MGQSYESLPMLDRREVTTDGKGRGQILNAIVADAAAHLAKHAKPGDSYTAHAFRATLRNCHPSAQLMDAWAESRAVLPEGGDEDSSDMPDRMVDHAETPGGVPLRGEVRDR